MFSIELVDILSKIPNMTSKNFSAIDNFLGEVGQNNIFKKNDLLRNITQKNLIDKIIEFLLAKKIITPYNQICINCGKEQVYHSHDCSFCGQKLEIPESVYYFKIVGNIEMTESYKTLLSQNRDKLAISAFKLILKKIEKKKNIGEKAFIIFIDIANSTLLSDIKMGNPYLSNLIKKSLINFLKDIVNPFFLRNQAIYIKADGDSSSLYFDNKQTVIQFITEFIKLLPYQDFQEKVNKHNEDSEIKIYYKIFISSSEILGYQQTGILNLDFSDMEAFVFINRIEKLTKEELLKKYSENDLIPFFIVSRDILFSSKRLELSNVKNYGDISVYSTMYNDIQITDNK